MKVRLILMVIGYTLITIFLSSCYSRTKGCVKDSKHNQKVAKHRHHQRARQHNHSNSNW